MRQILPHALWIGHANDGRNYKEIFDAGIQAIVQVAVDEPALEPPRELIYCRFPLVDASGNERRLLYLAVVTVANLLEKNVPTLVCCGSGMSRSPVIAAAALAMVRQDKPDDCLRQIAEHHPHDVTAGLWVDVKKVCDSLRE
jgi:protein-tyrosine phosphatase